MRRLIRVHLRLVLPLVLRLVLLAALTATLLYGAGSAVVAQESDPRLVDVIEIDGLIEPQAADYLRGRLEAAEADNVHAAIVQLDTPGGLDPSLPSIIEQITSSEVPVVAWIAPRGAVAASGGTFITYAAHLAYMAEATELGPAVPVVLDRSTSSLAEIDEATQVLRTLAVARDRNVTWAESAPREGATIGATTATETNVVNGTANSLNDLLEQIDGQTVELDAGATLTLETWDDVTGSLNVTVRFQNMTLTQKLLHSVTDPELAYLLLLLGCFGLIFELYNPGIGLAALLGALALLLAFYSLSVLPTNWIGVLLIVSGVGVLLIDMHTGGLGAWTVGGIAGLVAGGMLLLSGAPPQLALSPWAIVLGVLLTLVFFISVMTAALRVRLRRPITSEEGIVGTIGEAKTDIAPEGTVLTNGTLWRARTMETGIAAGERVKVMASEGLVLLVEPVHERDELGS